jgi:hypothetical protein
MASCSQGQLGALYAESYAERVISVGKQVLTEGNTLLSDEEVDMVLVLLRMNEPFIVHMQKNYAKVLNELFGRIVVREQVE